MFVCIELGGVDTEISTNAAEGLCECSSEDIKQKQVEGIVKVYVFGIHNMSHFPSESIINIKPHWYIHSKIFIEPLLHPRHLRLESKDMMGRKKYRTGPRTYGFSS